MTMNKKLIMLALAYLGGFLFFAFVNPEKLPLILILLPFIIIFLLIYISVQIVLDIFFTLKTKRQSHIISLVLAVMPVLMLIIQTVTQLTVRDVILSISITTILIWYSLRSGFGSKQS